MPILELKQTLQDAASATGDGLDFMCEGLAFVTMQVTGTFSATITFEATVNGTDWVAVQAKNQNDGSIATTATAVGLYSFSVAGYLIIRARVTWTSGTSITVETKGTYLAPGVDLDVMGTWDDTKVLDPNSQASGIAILKGLLSQAQGSLSAFGDLRVVEASPIFHNSFEYTVDNTELITNTVVNGGTVTQANAMAVVSTSTTTASSALLQSKRHAKYKAGFGGLLRFTTLFTAPVAATEQYGGIMDETGSSEAFKNGYGIGYNGTTFGFQRWQNDSLITIDQADWDDPLDGTGSSGMTIDFTKLNVWQIQFQYLGSGAIRLFIEDDSTGMFVLAHAIQYANANITPSTHNPNFRFTLWTNNKATTSNLILKSASYAFFIEGTNEFVELHQPQFSSGIIQKTSVTTEVAIFTIRNKALYTSKTNFIDLLLELTTASIEANQANNLGRIRIIRNTALGGTPSYSDINTSDSIVDIDTAGTTVTGGKEIVSFQLAGKNDNELLPLVQYKIILAPGETVTVAGTSANSATIDASILWKELF